MADHKQGAEMKKIAPLMMLLALATPASADTVVLLDISQSMNTNDPEGTAYAGVELIAALSRPEDKVGVASYHQWSEVLTPLAPVGDRSRFHSIRAKNGGQTNYVAGLEAGYELLEAARSPAGSLAIFLSDGFPSHGPLDPASILAVAKKYQAKGWRVTTVALGRVVNRDLLGKIALATGGSHHRASSPRSLLSAFAQIAAENLGYLVFTGFDDLPIPPATARLAYVAGLGGKISGVRRGSVPVTGLPYKSSLFEATLLLDPAPGVYQAQTAGTSRYPLTLVDASFRVEFVEAQPPASTQAEAIPVAIRVVPVGGRQLPPGLMDHLAASVRLEEASTGALRAEAQLAAEGTTFAGSVKTWLPEAPEVVNVVGRVGYKVGDSVLELSRRVSIQVRTDPKVVQRRAEEARVLALQKRQAALASVARGEALDMVGEFGWLTATIRFVNTDALPVTVALELQAIGNANGPVLKPRLDIELDRGDWDGSVPGGEAREVTYRVFLPSDMARGKYKGSLVVVASAASLDDARGKIDVNLEVQ
jgi:hypothetical protein